MNQDRIAKSLRRALDCAGVGRNRADLYRESVQARNDRLEREDRERNGCRCGPADPGKRIIFCPVCGTDRLSPEARDILGMPTHLVWTSTP